MPRYKVKAADGKTLTIEAADEAALDEAMAEYEASASPAAQSEKGWGETFVSQLPFGATLQRVAQGQSAYDPTAEGVAAGAGDIGTAAGLGAAGMMLGAAPVAGGALLGAGIGTLGEKTGAYDAMRQAAQAVRGEGVKSPETTSVPLNMLGLLGKTLYSPRENVAMALEALPMATTALASLGAAKGAQAGLGKLAAGPAPLPAGAGLLEQAGVKVTPAMKQFAETGQRTGMPVAVENLSKINPLTAAAQEANQFKAASAIKGKLGGIPGAEMTPQAAGGLLSDTMEAFQKRRGAAVGAAKEALQNVEGGDVGKVASNRIIAQLEQAGIPVDESGFNPAAMRGTEKMGKATAEALVRAERDLRGATLGEAINYLENFDDTFGADLAKTYGDRASNAVKEARNLIKTSIVESARSVDPALAKALQDADRAYAISQPTTKPFLKAARGETVSADLPGKLFGKAGAKGEKSLSRLQKTMTPEEFGAVQDTLASEVLRQAGGLENLSLPKLKTALRQLGENKKFLKPGVMQQLEDAALMMETAQVADLGVPNPSGTATRLAQASMTSPVGLIPAAVQAPFIKAYQGMPGAIRGLQRTAQPLAQRLASQAKPMAVAAPSFYQALNQAKRQ